MDFPKTIIGIGGAGKKLIYSLLNNDWILEEMLRPQLSGTFNSSVYIIDTAKSEENNDLKNINQIKEKINKMRGSFAGGGMSGDITFDYQLFTKEMRLNGPYDLMGKEVINAIKRGTGIENWWFDKEKLGAEISKKLDEEERFDNLNFSEGVVRRRALGKAIFYKAVSEDKLHIDLIRGGKVALIVGLGGGTGSGVFIDYAKKLKQVAPNIDIILFAVLPSTKESDRERANGYASLCELEYLRLEGELNNYFEKIILLPMEPTKYAGQIYIDDSNKRLMDEFHSAFAYTFISYFNLGPNSHLLEHANDYGHAPYVTATSSIIRYNVLTNQKIVYDFNNALLSKKEALKEEEDINTTLLNFLKEIKESELTEDDNQWLTNKLNDFKKLLLSDAEFFSHIGYQGVKVFGNAIINAEGRLPKNSSITDKITEIKSEIEITRVLNPRDEIDTPLKEVVNKELSVIYNSAKLLSKINSIEGYDEKRILKEIIRKDTPSGKAWVEKTIGKLNNEFGEISIQIQGITEGCKTYKANSENKIKTSKIKILNEIKEDKDKLQRIKSRDFKEELEGKLNNLKKLLDDYANNINNCKKISQLETINTTHLNNALNELYESIKIIDNRFSVDSILSDAEEVKKYKEFSLKSSRNIPITDKILDAFGIKTNVLKNKKIAESEKTRLSSALGKDEIFDIKDEKVIIIFRYDINSLLSMRIERVISDIVSKINILINSIFNIELDLSHEEKLKNSIKENNFENVVEQIIKEIIKYDLTLNDYENKIKDSNNKLKNIKNNIVFLQNLNSIYISTAEKMLEYREKIKQYINNLNNFEILVKQTGSKYREDEDRYIFEIEPRKMLEVIGRDNIKMFLQSDKKEQDNLMAEINKVESKLLSINYNGLSKRVLEHGVSGRWTVGSVIMCTSSIENLDNLAIDKNDIIGNLFRIENKKIGHRKLNIGGNWDVGCTIFIAGVFLDNIFGASSPTNGYYVAYQNLKERMNKLIFLHHNYLLDKGKFLIRPMLSLEEDANKKLFTTNISAKINEELKARYEINSYTD